jgi:hypothetical protein
MPVDDRLDGLFLHRAKRPPAEGVDDVVDKGGMQLGQSCGHGRSSSTSPAPAALLRSTSVSSALLSVNA